MKVTFVVLVFLFGMLMPIQSNEEVTIIRVEELGKLLEPLRNKVECSLNNLLTKYHRHYHSNCHCGIGNSSNEDDLFQAPNEETKIESLPNQFPWQVKIVYRGETVCGGTLIGRKWVLTAENCFIDARNGRKVPQEYFDVLFGDQTLYDFAETGFNSKGIVDKHTS